MTAARLRRVGNQGHLVDPGAVVALFGCHKPEGVRVVLEGGLALDVWRPARDPIAHRAPAVTQQDVDNVHRQLTVRPL